MANKIGVFVAWPYANGPLHLGHIAGAYLTADIFARYHRLLGNDVLMVSGSDTHGTPVTVTAEEEHTTPHDVFQRYHHIFLKSLEKLGISFDLFTHTDTENHHRVSQDIFLKLYRDGHIYQATEKQLYCQEHARFLPDRYIGGECPICHYPRARGDQCENCGNLLDALQLVNPRCLLAPAGEAHHLEVRDSEHFYLDLPKFNKALLDWARTRTGWKPNVLTFTLNYLRGDGTDENPTGLHGRAITRDLDWGISLPPEVGDYPGKRIYVWFEAVIGYYSASIEWAANNGRGDQWKEWWKAPVPEAEQSGSADDVRPYYFIGKDNIPFHTVIWPAIILGYGDGKLPLPYDVPANEFLNLEGRKISKSAHWAVWINDYLDSYDPDPLRYLLTSNMPEYADTDFTWHEFVRRNNDELVGTWGNLANRVITFAYKNFDKQVPAPGELTEQDRALIAKSEHAFETVGAALAHTRFRDGIQEAFEVAREANAYLNANEPWKTIKQDRARAATVVYVALRVIDNLKTLLYPYLPFSSADLHRQLGYAGSLAGSFEIKTFQETTRSHEALVYSPPTAKTSWAPSTLAPGQKLGEPKALYKKLEESIVEVERAKLGK
ncbi:MAG: methionine--tRNA ligase [Anaerolineae bacterium]